MTTGAPNDRLTRALRVVGIDITAVNRQATTEQALTIRCRCGAEPGAWCFVSVRRKLRVSVGFVHTRRRFAFTRKTGVGADQLQLPRAIGA